jgi:hypothetical protein
VSDTREPEVKREQDDIGIFLDKFEAGLRKLDDEERAAVLAFGNQMLAQIERPTE